MAPTLKCLVTGGAGFLGQHVVQQLVDSGKYEVTVLDVRPMATPPAGIKMVVGDLRKADEVAAAVAGMDVVFHVATAAPTGENALNIQLMESVNVTGTKNMIDACLSAGVKKLVYTSSASVVFEGRSLLNVDETTPYATKPMDYYTRTKIDGEKLVLAANCAKLATVALRPSGIFGEGDAVFVPTLVRNARAGKMKFIIGDGSNLMDFTYAGNVARAHLQAADALRPGSAVAGQVYFITNDEPVPFWSFMGDTCEGLGYDRPSRHLPFLLIIIIAAIFEYIIRPLLAPFKQLKSDFTVNRILIATTNRSFSCAKAKKDFGYTPTLKVAAALQKTLKSFPEMRAEKWREQQAAEKAKKVK